MASIQDNTNRFVLPIWRSFSQTLQKGECSSNRSSLLVGSVVSIDMYIEGWNARPSVGTAADLISASIANDYICEETCCAAAYIMERKDGLPTTLVAGASYVIDRKKARNANSFDNEVLPTSVSQQKNLAKEQIHFLREHVSTYIYNYIAYCELARHYVGIGLFDKADKMMQIALQLAPHSRYVVRCATRLYSITKDFDKARYALASSQQILTDPWLLSADISIRSLQRKPITNMKKAKEMLQSGNYSPFSLSELASALGTLELEHGSYKQSRAMFRLAMTSPNDNTLAQVEWVGYDRPACALGLDLKKDNFNAEAIYWKAMADGNYIQAQTSALKWYSETPFTIKPLVEAAEVSYAYLKDYDKAIECLTGGLSVVPQNLAMLNNLAYSYALSGKLDKAEDSLQRLYKALKPSDINQEISVCYVATSGLVAFRKGNIDEGLKLYQCSIDMAKGDKSLVARARLNMIREQIISGTIDLNSIPNLDVINSTKDRGLEQLKKDVLDEIERRK